MWELLPSIVLFNIYKYVDLKTKLSASAACRKWREVLFNPRCNIHENLCLKLQCRPPKFRLNDTQRDMFILFMRHARCLIIDWCDCLEDLMIRILSSVNTVSHTIERVYFLPKGSFLACKKKGNHQQDESCSKDLSEAIINFVHICKNIRGISFGSNSTLAQNKHIIDTIKSKLLLQKLTYLDVSYFYKNSASPKQSAVTEFKEAENLLCCLKTEDNLFMSLKELRITWDDYFEDVLTYLVGSSPVEVLGLLVQDTISFHKRVTEIPVSKLWKKLKSHKTELQVKLNLTEISEENLRHVLDKEMPLSSLCIIYYSEVFPEVVIDHLRNTHLGSNIEEIGFHYVESPHFRAFRHNTSYSDLITHLDCLKHIKRISWSGHFVLDTDVLFLITQHASTLQEFLIHKQEIVCESKATHEYFIPLSEAKVYGLEKIVTTVWRKPWKMIRDLPVQRIPRRGVKCHYTVREETFLVLQNKGF